MKTFNLYFPKHVSTVLYDEDDLPALLDSGEDYVAVNELSIGDRYIDSEGDHWERVS